jgi:lipopolysaccharide export system permease protein
LEESNGATDGQTFVMKKIDSYILRRYLITFTVMLFLFIPIGIMANIAEQIGKMIDNQAPTAEIIQYYINFTLYIGTLLFPIFLFLSVIFFTSKLANNTEIIAILGSGISYERFLRPYLIGAGILASAIFLLAMFLVPRASLGYNEFVFKYLKAGKQDRQTENIYTQINEREVIYVSNYDHNRQRGYQFTLEHFDSTGTLSFKINASSIRWKEQDSVYQMIPYTKRIIKNDEVIRVEHQTSFDTIFPFELSDMTPVSYVAETKNLFELNSFIEDMRQKGASNINTYVLVKYKRWALPFSIFVLTIIGVSVSANKRRGGMGINLALGVLIAFLYIFFDRVFSTMAQQSGLPPLWAVLIPNAIFGALAVYLLHDAKKQH